MKYMSDEARDIAGLWCCVITVLVTLIIALGVALMIVELARAISGG